MFDPTAFFTQYQALKGVKPETWDKLSQTWPAKMAQSAWNAATLPGDVWNGQVDPMSDESIGRATDLAGLTMSSTLASPRGSIGVGPVLPKKPNVMTVEPPTPMTMQPPQGIRAYHGSPHDFDKFDISKIGTGEGAQVYGHGLYFAENEGVAKSYRDMLAGDFFKTPAGSLFDPTTLQHMNTRATLTRTKDLDAAIKRGLDILPNAPAATKSMLESDLAVLQELKNQGGLTQAPGRMYEVNINARPEQFLDWDKPIKEQPLIMNQLKAASKNDSWLKDFLRMDLKDDPKITGDLFHDKLKYRFDENQALANPFLTDQGIPGIRYLDQGSRGQGNGTFNYVVFNDALIDILKKYGIAGMAAAPVIAGAVNQQEPVANY